MGDKDITEKTLEAYNDVFADIVNMLLLDANRIGDLKRATIDVEYRKQLLSELMPTENNDS